MSRRLSISWVLVVSAAAGCRVHTAPQGPAAAIFAGSAVAASAVNRKMTGDCYAVCLDGWHCDRESGLCRRNEQEEGAPPKGFRETGAAPAAQLGDSGSPVEGEADSPPRPSQARSPVQERGEGTEAHAAQANDGSRAAPGDAGDAVEPPTSETAPSGAFGSDCGPPMVCALEEPDQADD